MVALSATNGDPGGGGGLGGGLAHTEGDQDWAWGPRLSVLPLKERKKDIQIEVSMTAFDTPDETIVEILQLILFSVSWGTSRPETG